MRGRSGHLNVKNPPKFQFLLILSKIYVQMKLIEPSFIPHKFHIEWVSIAQVIGSQFKLKGTALFPTYRILGQV